MMTYTNEDCMTALKNMPDKSENCCVTSPPYWGLRDYGVDGQIGQEKTPEEYVAKMVEVFREVRRVLRDDGNLWLNIGDSYNGSGKGAWDKTDVQKEVYIPPKGTPPTKVIGLKPKDLIGIPWRVAFALQADGWYLRQDIIWAKPNPMPESVKDRCTKSHEYIFLLSKSAKYYYDAEAIKEPCSESNIADFTRRKTLNNKGRGTGTYDEARPDLCRSREAYMPSDFRRNKRSVWTVSTKPFKEAHFATFPPDLIEPCILAGCPKDGIVLDPFMGAGTTALVAWMHERNFIGCEINKKYCEITDRRLAAARMQITIDHAVSAGRSEG